jgi:hypothetical protein
VKKIKNIVKKCTPLRHGQYLSSDGVVSEWSSLPRSMKLDINLHNKLENSGMDVSFMAIKTN